MQGRIVRSIFVVVAVSLAGCAPSLAGLAAAKQGGDQTTVVNPTLNLTTPAAFQGSASLQVIATTTPTGQPVEANLDAAGWQRVDLPWQMNSLSDGAHSARIRIVGASASERSFSWTVDTIAPAAPSGVAVAADSAGELSFTWTAGSDSGSGLADYTIEYGTSSGDLLTAATVTAPATSAAVTGLQACQTYYATVKCTDRAGNHSSTTTEVQCRANCGGDGAFDATAHSLSGAVGTVARGDWNGDGIADLALGNQSTLQIMLGLGSGARGDGTFSTGTTHDVTTWIDAIAVGDFNADRIQDLVLVNDTSARVFLGQGSNGVGDGTFAAGQTLTSNLNTPQTMLVHDCDGDHIADLVVGDWSGSRLVFFTGGGSGGRGDGTFSYSHLMTTCEAPGAIATGDFNADGIADLAVAGQGGGEALVTHLGNGSNGEPDGTFASKQTWLSGGFVAGDVLVTDMNGDHIDDLVVTLTLANCVCFLAGSGSGGRGSGNFYLDEVVGVGQRPWGLLAGDFNGDNLTDYATLSYLNAGVTLVTANGEHGRGDGTFATSEAGGEGASLFHGTSADFDGNGSPDMLVGSLDGGFVLLANHGRKGTGDGTFADRGDEPTALGSAFGVAATDLDSDHVPDVMVASFQTPYSGGGDFVLQYLNVESGGLGTGQLPSGQLLSVGSGPTAFAFGDFQRDGIADIAVLCSDLDSRGGGDRVDILTGAGSNGVGTGGIAGTTSQATGTTPRGIVAADFNADAILDLAVTNHADDTVTILLGDGSGGRGDGTFTAQSPIAAGTGPFAIVTGDFNADGITDLAIGNVTGSGSGALTILLGQGSNGRGDGTFAAGSSLATTAAVAGLVAGDFNGDGITDLAGTQYRFGGATVGSGVIVFAGDGSGAQGDGTFTAGSEVAIGGNPFAIATADFDGNGILDLAVTDSDAARLAVLFGQGSNGRGNGALAGLASVTLATPSLAVTSADLDSDGIVDLIAAGQDRVSPRFGGGTF